MTSPTSNAIIANIGLIEQRLFRASTLANAAHAAATRRAPNLMRAA